MLQVLKVLVLSRVTLKSLKSLPGLDGCQMPADAGMLGSNVYSTPESVLLTWLTLHLRKVRSWAVNLDNMCIQYNKQAHYSHIPGESSHIPGASVVDTSPVSHLSSVSL